MFHELKIGIITTKIDACIVNCYVKIGENFERETGFEPATFSLEG